MAAMKKNSLVLLFICMFLSSLVLLHAHRGIATFYTDQNPSACLGSSTPTEMVVAGNTDIYDGGKGCGKRFRVSCIGSADSGSPHPCNGGSVEVQLVDLCPGCRANLDLSKDAFAAIADTNAGVIKIEFDEI